MQFENRVILITGGASGIGRAAALAFAQEGGKIVVADINEAGGTETVQQITSAGGSAHFTLVDVTDGQAVRAMVDTAVKQYGGLDVAVNNAGIASHELGFFQNAEEADYDRIMGINARGVWYCMKYELPVMLQQSSGCIVNVASVAGLVGLPGDAIYTASKHAVVGLTKAAAAEVARKNIRVNAVCPGYTVTPMVEGMLDSRPGIESKLLQFMPMRRFGQPEEIAQGILWLASDKASFVTGAALPMDGGITTM